MGEEKIPTSNEINQFLKDIDAGVATVVFGNEHNIKEDLDDNIDDEFAPSLRMNSDESTVDEFIKKHGDARIS